MTSSRMCNFTIFCYKNNELKLIYILYYCWSKISWNHNWNFFFLNLNLPPQLPSAHTKIHHLFWLDLLKSHLPDQQKSAILGNWAKISCGFLRMERDQLHFWGFLPTAEVIFYVTTKILWHHNLKTAAITGSSITPIT